MHRLNTRWSRLFWLVPVALAALAIAVLVAQWLRAGEATAGFFIDYPGSTPLPANAPVGIPAWLAWLHFLHSLFLLFIVRSGLRVYGRQRPPAFWTRNNTGLLRTRQAPRRMTLHVWWHLVTNALWVITGVVYIALLIASGHWMRVVPTSWDVVPNAVSAGIQYLSLDWPLLTSWTNYNSLQLLSYFATVFIAAPLALITGLRLAPAWPARWTRPHGILGERWARWLHLATLVYFVAFTIVHLALVLATSALRNLNYMYAARNESDWVGAGIFAISVVVMAVLWVAASDANLTRVAERTGKVQRLPGGKG